MARPPASVAASRIQIEDEVWEEAFSYRVPSRRRGTSAPVRPGAGAPASRVAEATVIATITDAPILATVSADPPAARRTVRIQGRGADPYRSSTTRDTWTPSQTFPVGRSVGSNPDRLAMWAALLGFLLVVVALLSSHL